MTNQSPGMAVLILLTRYIKEWKALDSALNHVGHWPIISSIRFHRILRAQHRLTKKFENDIKALQTLKK